MVKINQKQNITKRGVVRKNPPKTNFYDKVILDAIDTDGYTKQDLQSLGFTSRPTSPKQKLTFLKKRFETEYGFNISRMGYQGALAEWYQGLAIDLPFYNSDIIELAKKGGTLSEDATERQEQRILDNYWNYMANVTMKMFRKYKVE